MPKAACNFRRRDVTAAVQAVLKAGVEVASVEITPEGVIRIVTGKAAITDDLDRELAEFTAKKAQEENPWDNL